MDIVKNFAPLHAALDAVKAEVDAVKARLASDDVLTWRNAVYECGTGFQVQIDAVKAAANDRGTIVSR